MSMEPGDAFAIKINPHLGEWDEADGIDATSQVSGTASSPPLPLSEDQDEVTYSYGQIFADENPRFTSAHPSLIALLEKIPDFFTDQILFFFGPRFTPSKAHLVEVAGQFVYGVYRVRSAQVEVIDDRTTVVIEPHLDGWARFPINMVNRPRQLSPALRSVPNLFSATRTAVQRFVDHAEKAALRLRPEVRLSTLQMARVRNLNKNIDTWADLAATSLSKQFDALLADDVSEHYLSSTTFTNDALAKQLLTAMTSRQMRLVQGDGATESGSKPQQGNASLNQKLAAEQAPEALPAAPWRRPALPESKQVAAIERAYGPRTLKALRVATTTKPMLLLAGPTGVGKSWLARHLIDDPERERTVTVPVASTWRGRDDFLGYVNPITSEFEPSEFTLFLKRAEQAWDSGDRRLQIAVLEEFNLSPPEHWLSDLLVRLEYPSDQVKDRTISLGGTKVSGWDNDERTSIFLPPTLLLIGTLNQDHTVRKLSPRVMDRSALVEITVTVEAALARAGLGLLPRAIQQIAEELTAILEPLGTGFSVRTAISLRETVDQIGRDEAFLALDHVLAQEVLSKVRLNAGDPSDEEIAQQLFEWANSELCTQLDHCRERVSKWKASLEVGRDIFQA